MLFKSPTRGGKHESSVLVAAMNLLVLSVNQLRGASEELRE